jgi:hypothetical protein
MNYPLAANIVVYVFKDGAWTVGSTSDLVFTAAGAVINLYDTNAQANGYEFATVAK